MRQPISRLLFDRNDQQLLVMLDDVFGKAKSSKSLKNLLNPYLHPHGIKELAAPPGLRLAVAMLNFLDSLEVGMAHERVSALRSAREEVLSATCGPLRNNTARVLLQIMKELVRTRDDRRRQLELAHDFRTARSGKPRVIRALLRRYHLLEMPEAWNQIAFDDHVHDANTKGRKSPTHLVMDAWIKGIRHLTVVYYNYIEPEAAAELLEAAGIMGMTIRIGLSLHARFRNRFVPFIWVPVGFADTGDFLNFLAEEPVKDLMAQGRQVSAYRAACVLKAMEAFNHRHRPLIEGAFDVKIPLLEEAAFLSFVGAGQVSNLHLAEFIHLHLFPILQERVAVLREQYFQAPAAERLGIKRLAEEMNALDSEAIVERFLRPACNPDIPDPNIPGNSPDEPDLLKLTPPALIHRIRGIHPSFRITLNPGGLTSADILEILYDCRGMITHLEVFNLKDYASGKSVITPEINELQLALNEGNVIVLKRAILGIIDQQEACADRPPDQIRKLRDILRDISGLKSYYKQAPLRARIGSDSTGRSHHLQGMGLAILETLPPRAQQEIHQAAVPYGELIPIVTRAYLRETYIPRRSGGALLNTLYRLARSLPGMHLFGQRRREEWVKQNYSTFMKAPGNIATLSAVREERRDTLTLEEPAPPSYPRFSWKYLNSHLKTSLKVAFGFIPAFLTFYLSKDWWVLAYGGAFIWFGITGLRNVIQSVMGGGGLRRTTLLHWKDYVSWERLADSLMFTGFSVPLLDYFTKTLLLEGMLGITTASNPVVLYAVIAIVNGLYLSGHNVLRGLQRAAIVGSGFRSILSIPIAVVLNAGIGTILTLAGISGVNNILQQWAAVISKLASDSVAAVIEGLADRFDNLRMRARDYAAKLPQVFDAYARLELLFPEEDVLSMQAAPAATVRTACREAKNLEKIMIINALDLMYFWMYQPRAQNILQDRLRKLSVEERKILLHSQFMLLRRQDIEQMFRDGLIGRNYERALAFYKDRHLEYLSAMKKMMAS
ncbi:MAG: hypothetical protein C0394_06845 [Syntrophus sp. (in: bacteria)]|nr:hypothetical protein [Syntrophus sp. (in: bacteria)]